MDWHKWYTKVSTSYYYCVKSRTKSAFTLIECMVYMVVFMISAHILVSSISTLYSKEVSANNAINTILQIYSASDKLVDDIHHARVDTITKDASNRLSFSITPYEKVYWYIKNNVLMRASRKYNIKEKRWSNKTASVAAQGVYVLKSKIIQRHKALMIELKPVKGIPYSLYVSLSSKYL